MKRLARMRPSPAMVVACIALIVALGGTSFAAIQAALPKNSVGTKQIKNRAVTGDKVKARTLGTSKFKKGVLPDISKYYTKAQIDSDIYTKTQANNRFLRGTITRVVAKSVPAGASADVKASCPEGYEAIGGGADSNATGSVYITSSSPLYDGNVRLHTVTEGDHVAAEGWFVAAFNNSVSTVFPLKVAVICSPISASIP